MQITFHMFSDPNRLSGTLLSHPEDQCVTVFASICVGSWRTAFQPERTSMEEFHINDTVTVTAPLMTHTGQYQYLEDQVSRTERCSELGF